MPPFEHVLRGSSEGIVRGPGEWVVFSPKGWGVPVCVCACVVFAALRVAVQSPGRRLFPPPRTWKKVRTSPRRGLLSPPPRAKDAGSTTVLLWLVAGCLAGKQPAYTRAIPRVLRQSERVLPPWLWSPSGGVPNMAGSRTARSPVASAPFPARGLHPSTPSRPARGVTSGRESAFPHPVLGLVWLFGEPTCCVCLAWWLFPRSGFQFVHVRRRKAEARRLRERFGVGVGWGKPGDSLQLVPVCVVPDVR